MEVFEAIKRRRSIREFRCDEVPKDYIEKIIDAGRLAATASNIQPWEFIVVNDKDLKNDLYKIIKNNAPFLKDAPCAIVVVSKDVKHFVEDCSAATQNMLIAATALGLGSCWIAGYLKEYENDIKNLLNVPQNYRLVSIVVLGYTDIDPLKIKIKKRELKEVIHYNKF
jgi:nitroreductase